jgi:phage tail tape-measure protein
LKKEWAKLTLLMDKADQTWEGCKLKLIECKQFLALHLKIIEVSAWLENKKAFMEAEDLGESYADIDGILRKQQEFDRALVQQQKSFSDLKTEAGEVVRRGHFKRTAIEKSIGELEQKMEVLREKNATRVEELQMAKKCYLLLRKINEMRSW